MGHEGLPSAQLARNVPKKALQRPLSLTKAATCSKFGFMVAAMDSILCSLIRLQNGSGFKVLGRNIDCEAQVFSFIIIVRD